MAAINFAGQRWKKSLSSSSSSKISTQHIERILECLKNLQHRSSTMKNYYNIWKLFNKFLIRLDNKPGSENEHSWGKHFALYATYLVHQGAQSAAIKSYKSAVKAVLIADNYEWSDGKVMLNTITKACKIINDRLYTRPPIYLCLLEQILFEVQRLFGGCSVVDKASTQPYLDITYKAIFILAYYGLFRVGELTLSKHVVKSKDVHIANNQYKILIILYISKMHDRVSYPQEIKITVTAGETVKRNHQGHCFCPFKLLREFLLVRNAYLDYGEPLFIFRDGRLVTPDHVRTVLKI